MLFIIQKTYWLRLVRLWPIYNHATYLFDSFFAVEWICILYFKFTVHLQSSICYSVVCVKTNIPFLVPLLTLNFYVLLISIILCVELIESMPVPSIYIFELGLTFSVLKILQILGTGMSAKMWEAVVEHARTCVLDQKLYFYGASQKNGVVFNVVGQVMGSISNGQYLDADELSEAEKVCCFF